MPPNTPCPPTLVIDLEETLLGLEWDRKSGWRFCKRPGVDDFLAEMARYYEIVLFTTSHAGMLDEVVDSLDPKGYLMWRLYRDASRYVDGHHVKDISMLNRDVRRIIVVDDEPERFSLQPENGIAIKPYKLQPGVDPGEDHSLPDLGKFLKAVALEGVKDVRPLLRKYQGRDSDEIAKDYRSMVLRAKARIADEKDRGLGGLVRRQEKLGLFKPSAATPLTSKELVEGGAEAGASKLPGSMQKEKTVPSVNSKPASYLLNHSSR
ncbi:unnamed protein product [Chrysoparadoxa australica]